MTDELSILVHRLNNATLQETDVIPWSSPVLSFGNLSSAKIATIGLNPSNREFVDVDGQELIGTNRRFHTLNSLGITNWSEADEKHMSIILDDCYHYFSRNPYDNWFRKLDYLISGTLMSYYFPSKQACHLDLIPFATARKWTELTFDQKNILLESSADTLGILLRDSSVRLLILNGQTVVDNLQKISNVSFKKSLMPNWTLPRKRGKGVLGYAYRGTVHNLGGIKLKNEIHVLGFNHNIQSSFGVTKDVQDAIRNWITKSAKNILA
jgi:hypothetical protein